MVFLKAKAFQAHIYGEATLINIIILAIIVITIIIVVIINLFNVDNKNIQTKYIAKNICF